MNTTKPLLVFARFARFAVVALFALLAMCGAILAPDFLSLSLPAFP